jgi:hypothetical protein
MIKAAPLDAPPRERVNFFMGLEGLLGHIRTRFGQPNTKHGGGDKLSFTSSALCQRLTSRFERLEEK